jgi:hypothetical protein
MMFSAFCPTHDTRVLMTRRNIVDFWNGDDGPVIRWRCTCGQEGFIDHRGDRPDPRQTHRDEDMAGTDVHAGAASAKG